ncbi:HypC/HybG/HupF family hydrogenase formation chaperone [Candidatus Woesebacteria bacterium]|nr:HypC/HybG/HupF family hydrogenase formation chaperone [Candidatus Woesebacteria bacterium]
MCLAIPGQVKKIDGQKITVKYPGEERFALLGNEKLKKGDCVMVQMGIVIKVLSKKEAKESLKAWKSS